MKITVKFKFFSIYSEKLTEWSKLAGNLEIQVNQLKRDNTTLKIRLSDMKNQLKTPSTSSLPKGK